MKNEEWKKALYHSSELIILAKDELTEIDSKFGDADHGVTMEKVAKCIQKTLESHTFSTLKEMMNAISREVMKINGGSAVPLWATYLGGFAVETKEVGEITIEELKQMFQNALGEIQDITNAKVGDKTMMDTIILATEAILRAEGSYEQILEQGKQAAIEGAEKTKEFVSKFGRAKSYKEKTIGTPDAGAISAMYFFKGLSESLRI